MTPEETATQLNLLAKLMAEAAPEITQDAALQAKSLIQERIQESGRNAQEAQLNAYSPAYKKLREKKGYETSFTNLTFTGQMWRATRIIGAGQNGNRYEAIIGGGDAEAQKKLNYNSERYGDVLAVSESEEQKMALQVDDKLNELIKQAGL